MNSELIMKSDVLDILFEKRNKDYGAYTLRKYYNNRLIKSIGIMLAAVVLFSAFTFLPESPAGDDLKVTDPVFGKVLPVSKISEIKPKLIKPSTAKPVAIIKLSSDIIIVDTKDSADMLHNLEDRAIGSSTNITMNEGGPQLVGTSITQTDGYTVPSKQEAPLLDITKPMDFAEIMPEFPGGMSALRKFLVRHLSKPRELEPGELVSVKIKFVVGYDGKLQRFELLEDGGNEFNNEVMRVLKKMPAWTPGKAQGQNVSVYYVIPVKFIAED